jgi:7-cyano-7-deazaguanine synthase in queuosine biosynthesis
MATPYNAILMNSGGKDSLAAAIVLSKQGYVVHSIYVDAGQHPPSHAESAELIAKNWCDSHDVLTLRMSSGFDLAVGESGFSAQRSMVLVLGLLKYTPDVKLIVTGHTWPVRDIDMETVVNNYIRGTWRANFYAGEGPPKFYLPLFKLTTEQIYDVLKEDPSWTDTPTCRFDPPCGKCMKCTLRATFRADVDKVVQAEIAAAEAVAAAVEVLK